METSASPKNITVPILLDSLKAKISPRWAIDRNEYSPKAGTFALLINGEHAFGAIHNAIKAAKKSVSIICWGFQPSMYFVRDGNEPCIGGLLEQKARQKDFKVRILCWDMDINEVGVTGLGDEPNTPGRRILAIKDQPATMTNDRYRYNREWFGKYDSQTDSLVNQVYQNKKDQYFGKGDASDNLTFRGRGFSKEERILISVKSYEDRDVSVSTRGALAAFVSHHQKMVLIDYELPDSAIGFLMGHNMLDEYWDTDAHSALRRGLDSRVGANGAYPRQDFSSRLTGPILQDLYDNFQQAWNQSEKQYQSVNPTYRPVDALARARRADDFMPLTIDFSRYPQQLGQGQPICGQVLRTQPALGQYNIKRSYEQVVGNASQCIYIENQYFRWPPLAERIKQCARSQNQWGRIPERDGPLYLLVITNTTDMGVGPGAYNTYRMLDALGRADAIPAATRDERIEKGILPQSDQQKYQAYQARIDAANDEITQITRESQALDGDMRRIAGLPHTANAIRARYEPFNQRKEAAMARRQQAQQELDDWTRATIRPEELRTPGLKTHICRIVAPDSPVGRKWVETYIHAKLMMIDDTFMTLGSANINTRSMQVDTELNLAHDRPEITQPARRHLWHMHTAGRASNPDRLNKQTMAQVYATWGHLMDQNNSQQKSGKSPIAPLDAFMRMNPSRSNWD